MSLHITLRQLQIFDAVARLSSFTGAAHALHLTQPAVSMQIKQLQNMLGVRLFEVQHRRPHLTEAGRAMLRHSRAMLAQLHAMERDLHWLKADAAGDAALKMRAA